MVLSNEQIADRLADENYTGVPDEKDYLETIEHFRRKFLEELDRTGLLASATDLLNSWAREMGVREAHDELDIKGVIDRLWNELSTEMSRSAQKGALLRQMLKETKLPNGDPEEKACEILTHACQLVDSIKMDWEAEGCWSNWDQMVRTAMGQWLLDYYARKEKRS